MTRTIALLGIASTAAFSFGIHGIAQRPADNVSGRRHPNIAAAQQLATQAYNKVVQAQQANEWDMNGHAQHAKELLEQANQELKMAAETANRR